MNQQVVNRRKAKIMYKSNQGYSYGKTLDLSPNRAYKKFKYHPKNYENNSGFATNANKENVQPGSDYTNEIRKPQDFTALVKDVPAIQTHSHILKPKSHYTETCSL